MQFEFKSKAGQPWIDLTVNEWGATEKTKQVLYTIFYRLGMKEDGRFNGFKEWQAPLFISSQLIEEIIHNTCFVCGGLMQDSTALQNTNVSFDDFGNDAESRGTTQSRVGPVQQIKVRKCSSCGHSHT